MKKQNKTVEVCQKITDAFKVPGNQTKEESDKEMMNNLKRTAAIMGTVLGITWLAGKAGK